jgi:hypothetical protein
VTQDTSALQHCTTCTSFAPQQYLHLEFACWTYSFKSSCTPPLPFGVCLCAPPPPTPDTQVEVISEGDHVNELFLLVVGQCLGERGEGVCAY